MAYTLTAATVGTGSKNGFDEWLASPAELLAVLRIVGDEAKAHGVCALHIDAIAARAGVGRTTVRNALREARELGLVRVKTPTSRASSSRMKIWISKAIFSV
jgi:Bacterial regulatory proteins, gntR family